MTSSIDIIRPLMRTRQYRQFTSEPVTDDQLDALLRVARWTGSGGNSQPWRFIVVHDTATLRRLAEMAMPQTRSLRTAMAAIVITLPTEPNRAMVDSYDEGRLAERVLVAASMLGLGAGIAWVREEFRPSIHAELGVPEGRHAHTIMAIGHPDPEGLATRKRAGEARVAVEDLVIRRI